jgi:hypothetical protein
VLKNAIDFADEPKTLRHRHHLLTVVRVKLGINGAPLGQLFVRDE